MTGFDLDDLLPFGSVALFVLVLAVGLVSGWFSMRAIDVEEAAARLLTIGLPFFLTIGLYRGFVDDSDKWEVWIGLTLLYLVYIAGVVLGFWARRRTGHHLH